MFKYQILIKKSVLNCVFICCNNGEPIQWWWWWWWCACSNIATCTHHNLKQHGTLSDCANAGGYSVWGSTRPFTLSLAAITTVNRSFCFFTSSTAYNPMSHEAITTFRLSPLSRQWRYIHFGRPCLANVAGKRQLDYTGTPVGFSFHSVRQGAPGISRSHWVTQYELLWTVSQPATGASSVSSRISHVGHHDVTNSSECCKRRRLAAWLIHVMKNTRHGQTLHRNAEKRIHQMNVNRHCDDQPWRWRQSSNHHWSVQ